MGRRGRRGAPVLAAVVTAGLLAVAGSVAAARHGGFRAAAGAGGAAVGVAAPRDDASPQDVVRAFVADVNAHDERAAKRLLTPGLRSAYSDGADDLDNVVSMTDLVVTPPTVDGDGRPLTADSLTVHVPVSFILRQQQVVSMEDGPTDWGYLLVRERVGAPWRIYDQGVA